MKLNDLKIGEEVIVFTNYGKEITKGTIVELSSEKRGFPEKYVLNGNVSEFTVVLDINQYTEIKLENCWFKNDIYYMKTFWCLPNCTRFINHIKRKNEKENKQKVKKEINPKYKDLPHDNNQKRLEERLKFQRDIVGRIMENGYVWYRTINGWNKANAAVKFDHNKKRYYIDTPNGWFNIYKIGTTLSLENPEKGEIK